MNEQHDPAATFSAADTLHLQAAAETNRARARAVRVQGGDPVSATWSDRDAERQEEKAARSLEPFLHATGAPIVGAGGESVNLPD